MKPEMQKEYLNRINYKGGIDTSLQALKSMHLQHVTTVPFENLSIHQGEEIHLDFEAVFNKIVLNNRGGYCFETNALFAKLLEAIGFELSFHGARVWYGYSPEEGFRPRTHQVMETKIDGRPYLIDVAFGNGILMPLALDIERSQVQYGREFRVRKDAVLGNCIEYFTKDDWLLLYSYTPEVCYPVDYQLANFYSSCHPDSMFIQKMVCTMPSIEGRITLVDNQVTDTRPGKVAKRTIESSEELLNLLSVEFNIELEDLNLFSRFLNTDQAMSA